MHTPRLFVALSLSAAALSLGGCMGDGGYGFGGPGFAYQSGWGDPYWGWYGDYYYPGTGIYVYDSQRRRHRWNDDQRHHWEGMRGGWHGPRNTVGRANWHDFRRTGRPSGATRPNRPHRPHR